MTADAQAIRAALLHKSLVDSRRRALIAASLRLGETEVLAIEHLAFEGHLSIGELQHRLQLTSGGTTTLVQRLERAGHLARRPHPRDRRSSLIGITPSIERTLAESVAPLVAEIERAATELGPAEHAAVARFLARIADAAERQVEELAGRYAAPDPGSAELVTPARWG